MPARLPTQVPLANGVTLDCVVQGEAEGPAVLLLPGMGDSWRAFELVLDGLPSTLRAVAVSQRGHGDSSKPDSGYTPADYARDVVELLAALGIDRAVLVGHSSSTFTARLLAQEQLSLVSGLVLLASPLSLRDHPAAAPVSRELEALTDPVGEEFVRDFQVPTVGPDVSPGFFRLMVTEGAKAPARVWRETFRGLLEYDDMDGLGRITAPTLLVWGDADALVPRSDQETLLAGLPSSRLLVYPGIGHSPHWEALTHLTSDLTDFVDQTAS